MSDSSSDYGIVDDDPFESSAKYQKSSAKPYAKIAPSDASTKLKASTVNKQVVDEDDLSYSSLGQNSGDDDGSIVRWYKSNGLCISSADHLLLNRVQYLPSALFKDFIENDQ